MIVDQKIIKISLDKHFVCSESIIWKIKYYEVIESEIQIKADNDSNRYCYNDDKEAKITNKFMKCFIFGEGKPFIEKGVAELCQATSTFS